MNRIISMVTLLVLMVVPVSATTINIPADYSTIQGGIDASVDGDTVLVAQGIYYENLILETEIVFASHAIYDELGSEWLNNDNITGTIISGAQEPTDPNKGSCLIVRGGDIQPTVIGFTFKDGDGTSMLVESCELSEQDVSVRSGGGILMYKAYPTIMYNRFINNGHDNDNVRAGRGGRIGGAMGHFAEDGVEFDEDRSFSSQNDNQNNNSTRDIPETLNIQNNYFENNASGDGANFYSHGYDGSIDVSNSIFEDIDCETNSVNDFVLRSIEDKADYIQNDISGDCIESSSFYISSTGNDSNDGTESDPFKTIGRALTLVKPYLGVAGETVTTVNLASGTYSPTTTGEKFPIVLPENVHLIGEESGATILDAEADEENQAAVMIIKEVENVRVANLTLTGGSSESHGCKGGGGLLITANDEWNFGGPTTSTDVEIENVIIRNNTSFKGAGLSLIRVSGFDLNNIIIDQNVTTNNYDSYSNDGGGFFALNSIGSMSNVSITANDAYHAGTAAYIKNSTITMYHCNIADNYSEISFSTVVLDGSTVNLINSNIVGNNVLFGAGIMSCNYGHFSIVNSIIYDNCSQYVDGNLGWDCDVPLGPSNVLMWPGGQGYDPGNGEIRYSDIMGGWDDIGNINENPRFIGEDSGDYTLGENSPCIDAGTADLDGDGVDDITYYYGLAPDMGAFEYVGSGGPSGIMVSYNTGWNMVGLSLNVEDSGYQTLFPNAQEGTLYSFGDTYEEQNELVAGSGYLLRMTSDELVTFTGAPIYEATVSVSEGWNLFSGTSSSLSVEDLYANDIVYPGTVYGLDANYYNPETIEPGRGYWVRSTEDGEIPLGFGAMTKQVSFVNRMEIANSVSFTNENYSTNLYFGVEVPEEELLSYSLPPKFSQMDFDVRFSGDMKLVPESGEIEVLNHSEMLTIEYEIKIDAGDQMNWVLTSESGKDYILESSGHITVPSSDRFILKREPVIPISFDLRQNFPNPFNPITTLRYDLPSDALVTLSIYDMLGREITKLVNISQQAGFKSVQWDATDSMGRPVSAGVYLYQIHAGEFVQTKKMVLLK